MHIALQYASIPTLSIGEKFRNLFSFLLNYLFYYVYEHFVYMCMFVYHMHVMPSEARRGHQIPWAWSCRWLWTELWALGTKLRSSVRAANILSHWAIPLASEIDLLTEKTEWMLLRMTKNTKCLWLHSATEASWKIAMRGKNLPLFPLGLRAYHVPITTQVMARPI